MFLDKIKRLEITSIKVTVWWFCWVFLIVKLQGQINSAFLKYIEMLMSAWKKIGVF